MINSSCHTPHHAFHLEREQGGGEAADGDAGGLGQTVYLLVVLLLQGIGHGLFVGCKLGKERALYAVAASLLQTGVGLPSMAFIKSTAPHIRPALLSRIRLLQPSEYMSPVRPGKANTSRL